MKLFQIAMAALFAWLLALSSVHAQTTSPALRNAGISFTAPTGWSVEDLAQERGVLLMAPNEEAGWQANIFLELRDDAETRSLDRALADLSVSLEGRKTKYKELRRSTKHSAKGLEFGLLEYSHEESGATLVEREAIFPLRGKSRLFVLTSTAKSVEGKYTPIFDTFLNSVTAPR